MKASTKKSLTSLKTWFKGLVSAVIGGAANSGLAAVVAPDKFNIHEGLSSLLTMAAGGAVIAALMYLKNSPIPKDL
jgi:hypothetical protein